MSREEFEPLPSEYRVRADGAAIIGGAVVFFISGFLFNSQSAHPSSLIILALIAAVTAVAAAIAASDSFDDAIDHQELICRVRCGARTSGLGALVCAGSTVFAARVFASQGSAVATIIPSLLSILPSAFCGIMAAGFAAGIRVPKSARREPSRKDDRGGFTVFIVLLAASAFSAAFIPQEQSTTPAPFVASNATPSQMPAPASVWRSQTPAQTPYSETTVAPTPLVRWTPAVFETPTPTYPRSIEPNDPIYAAIYNFVMQHHNKINDGDIRGLLADYADEVVYFHNGTVKRDRIFQDEYTSRAKYRRYSEQVMQPINISEMSPHRYHAQYQIVYDGQKLNNQQTTGVAPVHLFISDSGNGLQIVSQQRELESGE